MSTTTREDRKAAMKARAVTAGYEPHVGFGEMLLKLDEVETADRDRLEDILKDAAYWYAASTLWAKLPADQPGDRSVRAMELRRQRAEIAETLWLATRVAITKSIYS